MFFLAQVFLRKQAPKRSDNPTRTPAPPKLTNATPSASTAPGPLNGTDLGATTAAATEPEAPAAPVAPAKVEAPSDEAAPDANGAWVAPVDGTCPPTHPIKAKLSSRIFHAPGGLAYDRTTPDRCYRDAASAEADGFRPAKR